MSTPSSPRTSWDRLLHEHPLDDDEIDDFLRRQLDAGLVYQGKPLARTLRPNLVEPDQLERDRAMTNAVVTALLGARARLLGDRELGQQTLGPWFESLTELSEIEPGYPDDLLFARLDVLPTADGPKVIEFNGSPGGVPSDRLIEPFMRLAERISFDREWQLRPLVAFPALQRVVVDADRAWGGTGEPLVIFAVARELRGFASSVQYTIDAMIEAGLPARFADPSELHFRSGALWHGGDRVGVLIRLFFPAMVRDQPERVRGIMQALRAGAVCMLASFRSSMLSHKGLFALIDELELEPEVRALIRAHVPWTRVLRAGTTSDPTGASIDLLEWALEHQDELVYKPGAGLGGAGVVLGWTVDADRWRDGLARACQRGGHVIQQRARLLADLHPDASPGTPALERYQDCNPMFATRELAGYLCRVSADPVINVSRGATLVPSFAVTPT